MPSLVATSTAATSPSSARAIPTSRYQRGTQVLEQVVLQSARPTLVLPYAGRVETLGAARNGRLGRQPRGGSCAVGRLAVAAACHAVDIVSWNEIGSGRRERLSARLEALKRWLMWQGVHGRSGTSRCRDIGIAEAMLSRAADMSVDLIVMGAYGHARWTERMLGGATRGLLAAMTVPVLMSH